MSSDADGSDDSAQFDSDEYASSDDDDGSVSAAVNITLADARDIFRSLVDPAAVNALLDNEQSLLSTAAAASYDSAASLALMRELLDAGADVRDGAALISAVEANHVEAVRLLLESGAPVDGGRGQVDTPICIAAAEGFDEIFQCLLDHGASLSDRDGQGESLLLLACSCRIAVAVARRAPEQLTAGDPSLIAHKLVSLDEGVAALESLARKLPDFDFREALQHACELANIAAARILLSETQTTISQEALNSACGQSVEFLDLLLEHGALALLQNSAQPLVDAVLGERIDVVRRLLALGVKPLEAVRDENGILHWCSFCDGPEILALLLPLCGHALETLNDESLTPLLALLAQSACKPAALEMARALLDAGANIAARDDAGNTSLICAADAGGSVELLHFLLVRDPSLLNARSDGGATALGCICDRLGSDKPVGGLKLLLEAGASIEYAHAEALVRNGRLDALQLLVEHGFDAASRGDDNRTLLMLAACADAEASSFPVEVAEWLVNHGVSVDAAARGGETALLAACSMPATELVRFLLDAGADINARTAAGVTPLIAAVTHRHDATVRLLVERGASTVPVGRKGQSIGFASVDSSAHECLIALAATGVDLQDFAVKRLRTCTAEFLFTLLLLGAVSSVDTSEPDLAGIAAMWDVPLVGDAVELPAHRNFAAHCRNGVRAFNRFCSDVVASQRLGLINSRAATICFALQSAQLPALQTLAIIDEACPLAPVLPMHLKWDMVAKIKHFRDKP
jgi:ankyrin repeat protein